MMKSLPPEIVGDANFDGAEYGWKITSFPAALAAAERLGFSCLGGQLQFRFDASLFEMYWLEADAPERLPNELWPDYVHRSCSEVSQKFTELLEKSDVRTVVQEWPALKAIAGNELDLASCLVFVAYFVTEEEYVALPGHSEVRIEAE